MITSKTQLSHNSETPFKGTFRKKITPFLNLSFDFEYIKAMFEKEIQTTYVQIDGMETFVNTRKTPYGIELAIRPKTGQILSAKVCRIPIKALSVSEIETGKWNSKVNRTEAISDMLIESSYAMKNGATIGSDGDTTSKKIVKKVCPENKHQIYSDSDSLWRINHACAKLRYHSAPRGVCV